MRFLLAFGLIVGFAYEAGMTGWYMYDWVVRYLEDVGLKPNAVGLRPRVYLRGQGQAPDADPVSTQVKNRPKAHSVEL